MVMGELRGKDEKGRGGKRWLGVDSMGYFEVLWAGLMF